MSFTEGYIIFSLTIGFIIGFFLARFQTRKKMDDHVRRLFSLPTQELMEIRRKVRNEIGLR